VRSFAIPALLCAFFLFGPAARQAAAVEDPVTWYRDSRTPPPPDRGGLQVPCGRLGIFQIVRGAGAVDGDVPVCAGALECGSETPPLYPTPEGGAEEPLAAAATAWFPCAGGSCFAGVEPPPSALPVSSWVAVIDWNQPHGWSVGWTLLQVANDDPTQPRIPAVLFDLDDPAARARGFSERGATDVHLLKKLCEIVEAVDLTPGVPPPLVINMSFGRRFRTGDARNSGTCNRKTLNCQIAEVETRLWLGDPAAPAPRPRSTLVAAAGNHREWLFPAGLDTVLPAGSLQLESFGQGVVERSWETPDYGARAQGLFPGYGLCLEQQAGAGESATEWAAPAGTSYAAAILSGWLAGPLRGPGLFDPLGPGAWFPKRACTAAGVCTYALAHGGRTFGGNPRVDVLLNRVLDRASTKCGTPAAPSAGGVLTLKVAAVLGQSDLLPKDSFIDVVGLLKLPTPDSRPCVPCQGMSSIGSVAARPRGKAASRWLLDLSANTQVPPPFSYPLQAQSTIARLYLHTSGDNYLVLLPESGDLNVLKDGTIHQLWLPDARPWLASGVQPSLVFVLQSDQPDLVGRPFWLSVPILVRN
jgi:hypothetical protein